MFNRYFQNHCTGHFEVNISTAAHIVGAVFVYIESAELVLVIFLVRVDNS